MHEYGAIGLYLLATALSTLGHVQLKLHANVAKEDKADGIAPSGMYGWLGRTLVTNRYVTFALAAYLCGGLLDLSVNRLIPFYIRACFAALDIPIYALFARLILGEIMDSMQVFGVFIAVAGCTSAVLSGAQPVKHRTEAEVLAAIFSSHVGVSLLITVPLFGIGLYVLRGAVQSPAEIARHDDPIFSRKDNGRRLWLFLCAVIAASLVATWASLLVRCVSELARFGVFDPATLTMFLLLVLASIAQVATIADMMKLFESIVTMPAYLILNAAGLAGYSALVFGELPQHGWIFVLSMALAFVGIGLIVHKQSPPVHVLTTAIDEKEALLT